MLIKIKPLSINEAYKGKKYKTDRHNQYAKDVTLMLPEHAPFKRKLKLSITFGFSSKGSDIDNCVKPFQDLLYKKYRFNDNQIYELNVKKEIVKKGEEFINFYIDEL